MGGGDVPPSADDRAYGYRSLGPLVSFLDQRMAQLATALRGMRPGVLAR
jgi:hypothetical protein